MVRREIRLPFADRGEAGELLAETLAELKLPDPVVLALPRGGVPVAVPVGRRLHVPIEVLVTRKIGHPAQPELGLGAIAEGGEPVFDLAMMGRMGLKPADLGAIVEREREELARRVGVYRGDRELPPLGGRDVIVVDDGLATGGTARAALRAVRALMRAQEEAQEEAQEAGEAAGQAVGPEAGPKQRGTLTLAVPVAAKETVRALANEADQIVVLALPADFFAVGQHYLAFEQLTDADVLALLAEA